MAYQTADPRWLHQSQTRWSAVPAVVETPFIIIPAPVQNPPADAATSPLAQTDFAIQPVPEYVPLTVLVTQAWEVDMPISPATAARNVVKAVRSKIWVFMTAP